MKLYNKKLEEIENQQKTEKIRNLLERMIDFLVKEYGINEDVLKERLNNVAIVERDIQDTSVLVEYNGKKYERPNSKAGAFFTKKNQEYNGEQWNFENAVYIGENNDEHQIIHELFHYLSSSLHMQFNEDGIGYDNLGVLITGYNRKDEVVDNSLEAKGLNEGITELLTTQFEGTNSPNVYAYQVCLADILINKKHNSLIKAYFSNSESEFKKFLEDLENRQSTISSQKLVSLSANGSTIVDTDLLKGCMEYTLSYCNNMDELSAERSRLLPIFKRMMGNLDLEYDNEEFDIKNFFSTMFNEKRNELKDKEEKNKKKDLLESAIEITEEKVETKLMEKHAEIIIDNINQRGKEKTEETERG